MVTARFQDAGSKLRCSCGSEVSVPALGKLRQLAGQDAYVTNAVEAIQKRLNVGESPAGSVCLVCGASDCQVYRCLAVCESTYVKHAEPTSSSDFAYLFGRLLFIFAAPKMLMLLLGNKQDREAEHFGRDTSVELLLPVCDACANAGHNPRKASVARELMQRVSLYKQLLDEYPNLKLEQR